MIFKVAPKAIKYIQLSQCCRHLNSKIPLSPVSTLENVDTAPVKVDRNTISLLERLSLVKYDTAEGLKILEDSITFADKILHVNTDGVQPLYSVLEDRNITLREDKITQGNCQKDILKNAAVKEDDYFVAPIGNIPLHEVEVDENTSSEYVYSKTHKQMPVYINGSFNKLDAVPTLFGSIKQSLHDYNDDTTLVHHFSNDRQSNSSELHLDLIVPQEDAMQYFVKWQRYRKYWWSSISTTPSLFSVKDIKYEDQSANADIIAKFPCGDQPVEYVTVKFDEDKKSSRLSCCISLQNALNVLLLDGLNNNTKEEYLRLHRQIAPYKISFGLDLKESDTKNALKELATLMYHKLESNKISTWLPDFTLPYESQIKENLHLGVTYTAILSEETLKTGIFKLMNSSTVLGEQVHVADFQKYAALIFQK